MLHLELSKCRIINNGKFIDFTYGSLMELVRNIFALLVSFSMHMGRVALNITIYCKLLLISFFNCQIII